MASTFLTGLGIVGLVAALLVQVYWDPIGAESWDPPKPLPVLQPNHILKEKAEKIFPGELLGPESLAWNEADGLVYSGLMNGQIVRFDPEHVERGWESFLWLNESCSKLKQTKATVYKEYPPDLEPLCGRPLGMRFNKTSNKLLVLESYSGILEIDMKTKAVTVLTTGSKLANDLDIDGNEVFFTESSPRWGRNRIILEILSARRTGKLLKLDRASSGNHQPQVIAENLPLTNGVSLSHNRDKVFFIAGPAVHSYDRATNRYEGIALDNLPCIPDNIRRNSEDGKTYLLACSGRRAAPFSLTDLLAPLPFLRELLVFLVGYNQYRILSLIPVHCMVMKINLETKTIERVIQDPTGSFGYLSEAEKIGEYLYVGSWKEAHITRIKWSDTGF